MGFFHSKSLAKSSTESEPEPGIPPPPLRQLFAFDFDNTILDGDSESCIIRAFEQLTGRHVPAYVAQGYRRMNDIEFPQSLVNFVTMHEVDLEQILNALKQIHLVKGMHDLLSKVEEKTVCVPLPHFIILSGSFDYFIRAVLSNLKPLPITPMCIIANVLTVSPAILFQGYEYQFSCNLCPHSLCKGQALVKYISIHGPFDQVVFICDGANDVCPARKLQSTDILFVRKGYALESLIKRSPDNLGIKAKITYFRTGSFVQQALNL